MEVKLKASSYRCEQKSKREQEELQAWMEVKMGERGGTVVNGAQNENKRSCRSESRYRGRKELEI